MKRCILSICILVAGCSSQPALLNVPCPKPVPIPAELSQPPKSPESIRALDQLLTGSSQTAKPTPAN